MSYLSFLVALYRFINQGQGEGKTFYEGFDIYLQQVVEVERFFLSLSIGVAILLLVLFIVGMIILRADPEDWFTCGCYMSIVVVIWPILELVTWFIATGLSDAVTPMGLANPTKFWILIALMALLGWG